MTPFKSKVTYKDPFWTTFRKVWGKKILPFNFLNLHQEFGNSFYSKFWHINQKKFMKQKRQLIDHRVAWRRPFLRFPLHFWDIVAGATHGRQEQSTEGRSNPPKVCLPPLAQRYLLEKTFKNLGPAKWKKQQFIKNLNKLENGKFSFWIPGRAM